MSGQQGIEQEREAALAWLLGRYGDRITPEMQANLRGAVETVVRTVAAVRAVRLDNDEAPLPCFAPVRKEE